MMMAYLGIVIVAFISIAYSLWTAKNVLAMPEGNDKMRSIAGAIQEGALAYLCRQYRSICVVGCASAVFLWWGFKTPYVFIGFVLGAVLSGLSGHMGMMISVRGNVRTAEAARKGLHHAFSVAFQSGAVTGFFVTGLALLGVVGYTIYLLNADCAGRDLMQGLIALSFGASLISIFTRLGGGIFTKGADVGADLVGKVESGIPEDDPRNPAVIADNVGDNVGDCAGMSADLFETYVVTLVASMQMALFSTFGTKADPMSSLVLYPLLISAVCVLGCIGGTFFVKIKTSIMGALYKGLISAAIFSAVGISIVTWFFPDHPSLSKPALLLSAYIGLITTGMLVWITEYYTASQYGPVQSIAKASVTGAGTNVIQGLAVSMEACFMPVIVISASILSAYSCAGIFGVSLAATSMLALMAMVIAIDAYGPVTDNAGGIAEMAGMPKEVRQVTDQLDAVGNTTKAVTKGYAIGSAALAALVLFTAYIQDVSHYLKLSNMSFDLQNPMVIVGLFIGGSIPYLFAAMSMKAVGKAASAVVIEVRRQFKEIKGIMDYGTENKDGTINQEGRPDYGKAVDILTKASIKAMILPSLLPVLMPIGVYTLAKLLFKTTEAAVTMLGGGLLGLIITGFFVAVSMTSGGGAWDNAKKYIESGHHGGKGSPAYAAAVIGDTVGDPCKDTVGTGINPAIKIANLVALLLLSFLQ